MTPDPVVPRSTETRGEDAERMLFPGLCYIAGSFAYFDGTHGDDWDDAPHEYNAGPPYHYGTIVAFRSYAYELYPGSVSVDQLNRRERPWLTSQFGDAPDVWAGVTVEEFDGLISAAGGRVFYLHEARS